MREGLRSSVNLLRKSVKNEVSPSELTDEEKPKLNQDEALREDMEVDQRDGLKIEECEGGSDAGECNAAETSKSRRKRSRVASEGESEDGSSLKGKSGDGSEKRLAEVKKKDSEACDHEEGKTLKRKRGRPPKAQKSDGSEKTRIKAVKEESNQYVGKESEQPDNEVRENLKPKRGTPPKVQKNDVSEKKRAGVEREEGNHYVGEESDRSDDGASRRLKHKRGRFPKAHKSHRSGKKRGKAGKEGSDLSAGEESEQSDNEVSEKSKPKRGRPPKAKKSDKPEKNIEAVEDDTAESSGEESDESYGKVGMRLKPKRGRHSKLNKGIKVGGPRKRQLGKKTRHNKNHNVGARSALSGGKKSNATELATARKIKFIKDEKEEGRNKQKAVVRDKIIELLLGAGWTIEHRPRNGRDYCDAVYVNPEGRTHWSVTLAYRILKQHYEGGGGDSNTCKTGFKFTPLPDDELSILTKIIGKERSDKNKKKKKWKQGEGGKTGEGVAKLKNKKGKLHKRKLDAAATPGRKKLKDRTKHKYSLSEQDDCSGTSDDRTAVKDRKQLKTHNRERCALMIRNSKEGADSNGDGYVLYNGKRTVLAWMIDLGSVPLDGKVQYLKRRKTRTVLKGKITTDGIQCDCCGETFAILDFESHAGSKSCQPLKNICLENGHSLLQCQLESWNKQDESDRKGFHFVDTDDQDPNDDTCGICGDGGNLICCDSCPSTFHQSCLEIKFPSGVWNCTYCSCKFCGMAGGDTCQMDENDTAAQPALLACCLCEEKYHHSCILAENTVNDGYSSVSFCGKKCQELYDKLQALLGVKHEMEEGFAWTLVRRFDVGSDISLSGMHRKVECNSKVAVALHIMDECFLPMPDHRSGVNLIRNIVYNFGSNFNRLNYSGFLTAILERGDEIISAASIRIHGNHLAEMPFIGTRHMYRRQGMCRRLLSAIETALCSLNVEKLVIPAISELRETWTSVFGFKPLEGSSKQKMRNMKMVAFPGIDMLQKPLLKHHQFAEANMVSTEGSMELKEHHTMDETSSNSDEKCSPVRFDLKVSTETSAPHTGKINDQAAAVESGSMADCLNDTSDITSENATLSTCPKEKTGGRLSVVPDNLKGRDKNTLKTPDYMGNVSGFIAPSDGKRKVKGDAHVNQSGVSEVESKLSGISFMGSEAADFQGQCQLASKEDTENVPCEVKVEDSSDRQNRNSVHTSSEIITSQPRHLVSELELEVSGTNAAHHESTTCNISGDVAQSTTTPPPQKVQDDGNDHCGILPGNQNISSCQVKEPISKEMVVLATADPNSDVTAKPDVQSCRSNGFCFATELGVSSCGVDVDRVHDLKEVSDTVQSDAISPYGGSISDGPRMNIKSSEHANSVSEVEPASLTGGISEPLCNSSSARLHCASGGGNSCGAPEVIILSNQAS
uniref:PHD-type domain-containing protein n=1 Tax=Populus trichocarpa TaxID=3694 RepID=A0A3N7EJ81_POPTR